VASAVWTFFSRRWCPLSDTPCTSTAHQELASQLQALRRAECHKIFQEQISTRGKVRPELIDGCLAETGLIITPEMIAKPEPANST
jgi:hypothetical protein